MSYGTVQAEKMTTESGYSLGAGNATSFKNSLINGRFDVWQRSVGPVTGSTYTTADRWYFPASGITSQQVANDRNTAIPYALQVTADGTGYGLTVQRIEDVRSLSGGSATLSFWAKSPTTGSFRAAVEQNFGSGGSTAVQVLDNATQFDITSANTWQFFTVTVTMPSVSGKTIGTSSFVQVGFGANSGTASRVMTYSEVQFEVGTVATSFDFRSYGTELQLCMRYCEVLSFENDQYTGGSGFSLTPATTYFALPWTQVKRATPTITFTGFNYQGQGLADTSSPTAISASRISLVAANIILSASFSGTSGQATIMRSMANSQKINISAEL